MKTLALPLLAALTLSAHAQTRMLSVGWEATHLKGVGANYWLCVNRNITIVGYNITFVLYPWTGQNAAALCTMTVGSSPSVTPDVAHFPIASFPGYGDCGPSSQAPYEGDFIHGGINPDSYLCRTILKTNGVLPASTTLVSPPGLSIQVQAGMWIISHVDVGGADDTDVEIQGVIYYQ